MQTTVKLEGRFQVKTGKYFGYENCITALVWDSENEQTIATDFVGSVTVDKYKEKAFITWVDNGGNMDTIYASVPYFENRKKLSTIAKNILIKELKKAGRKQLEETRYNYE